MTQLPRAFAGDLSGQTDRADCMAKLVQRIQQLHSSPAVAREILERTKAVDFDIVAIVRCLERDPALASRVLQLVNSARYGLPRKVSSLRQAVTLLGQRSLRLVAVTFSLVDQLTRGVAGEIFQCYWKRALTLAIVADHLAGQGKLIDKNAAYSAGLLADLGVLVLIQTETEKYAPIHRNVNHGPELVAAERSTFGCGHPALGGFLLAKWDFPPDLTNAVATHHDALQKATPLELIVRVADVVAEVLWTPKSPSLPAVRVVLERVFELDTDGFISLAIDCKKKVEEEAATFAVRFDGTIDCDALRDEARRAHSDVALEIAMDMDSLTAILDDKS